MPHTSSKIDRNLTGQTNPRRHRLLRTLMVLSLIAAIALVAVVAGNIAYRAGKAGLEALEQAGQEDVVVREPSAAKTEDKDEGEAKNEAEDPEGEETADAAEESVPVQVNNAELMMIGDILMHEGVIDTGYQEDGSYNFDHLFAHVAEEVQQADIRAVNQETPLAGADFGYQGYPTFNAPQAVGDAEAAVGFNVILKATNHTFDMGYDGIRSELAFWAESHPDMKIIGVANPDGDGVCPAGGISPAGPYLFEKGNFKIALLNYTDVLNQNIDPEHDPSVIGIMDEERIAADVSTAREIGADIVIVFAHWGEEYEESPTEDERKWADYFMSQGVDAVIGGHPHVIQPVEVLSDDAGHRMVVFWSVGNFISTQTNNRNMIGLCVKLSMVEDGDGARITAYEALPTVTHRDYGTNFSGYLLRDYTDDLAAANQIVQVDPEGFSVQWCQDYCARVLGEAYDTETRSVHGTL